MLIYYSLTCTQYNIVHNVGISRRKLHEWAYPVLCFMLAMIFEMKYLNFAGYYFFITTWLPLNIFFNIFTRKTCTCTQLPVFGKSEKYLTGEEKQEQQGEGEEGEKSSLAWTIF